MKKIVKLSLVLIMTIFIMGNVYAAISCKVNMQAAKTEVSKNEEFTVDINLSNIQSERGIISLGATLEYDKDSLTLVKMEGKNGWETPAEGTSYNNANGKLAITRAGLGKNDETVFTITFKVKETSKKNLMVTLKNIIVADGIAPANSSLVYQNITVTNGTPNPVPEPGTDDVNTENIASGNKTNTSTDVASQNKLANHELPKTGAMVMTVVMVVIGVAIVLAAIYFIRLKLVKKEPKQ